MLTKRCFPGPPDCETGCTVVLLASNASKSPEPLAPAGPWGSSRACFDMQERYVVYTQRSA